MGESNGLTIFLIIFGTILGALGAILEPARKPLYAFSVLCWLGVFAMYLGFLIDKRGWYLRFFGEAAQKVANLSDERFAALGREFPKLRLKWPNGVPELCFGDTNATLEHFKVFMFGSNATQIYPVRNCSDEAGLPRWAWREIRAELEKSDLVIPESHAGNKSWRWQTPQTYHNLRAFFGTWLDPKIGELKDVG